MNIVWWFTMWYIKFPTFLKVKEIQEDLELKFTELKCYCLGIKNLRKI